MSANKHYQKSDIVSKKEEQANVLKQPECIPSKKKPFEKRKLKEMGFLAL